MTINKDQEDKFLISFSDILRLFRQSKKLILICGLALGFAGVLYALTKPVRYLAEGTFREKGMKSNLSSSNALQLLGGGSFVSNDSEAASLMTTRKILKEVIEKLNLQAQLNASSDIETIATNAKHNLQLALASMFGQPIHPILGDRCCPLKIESLTYTGELPAGFSITLQKDGSFEAKNLSNRKGQPIKGKLGELFHADELTVILAAMNSGEPGNNPAAYILTVNPMKETVQELCEDLEIEPSKKDKSILLLKCKHRDRQLASAIVNATMESYQNYLKNYHADVAQNQVEYLNSRRAQLTSNLTDLMHVHADFLSDDLSHSGFIDSDKEMEFFARSLHDYKRKLLDNEMEIKRLASINPANLAYYDRYASNEGDPTVINGILSKLRALKYQRDALEIELQKKSVNSNRSLQDSFEKQVNELKQVQLDLTELRQIEADFQEGRMPDTKMKFFNDPRFLLKGWFERLHKTQVERPDHFIDTKENFQFYLNNIKRSLGVHEGILQERLTHQQNPSGEYQGIDLEVATELYLDYSKELIKLEGMIRKNLFFVTQIEDPTFEITSLSSGLDDPVSNNMIEKASELVLTLRDQNNQSVREQERIKEELNLQRTVLTLHLKQMVELMELNKQLFDEKIFALQNVSLELIHQQISLLDKNLRDYLKSRLENLQQERILIQRHIDSIHAEMAFIPQKWVSEHLLTQEVETNQKIVEEIAKLVESKNISHKLDVIQSAPIDLAITPVHPKNPKVFLWGILGFLLGSLLGSCFVLGKALKNGVEITADNLNLMGFHVSGPLNFKENFETLRRLQVYFEDSSSLANRAKMLLLIEGFGPDYAFDLADLFLKRGSRVLTIDLNFNDPHKIPCPGLLNYLQGEIDHLPFRKGKHGDWIAAGGWSPHGIELLNSPAFKKMLDQLGQEYDWILAVSNALPASGEAESLLALFPHAALTIHHETIDDLVIFTKLREQDPSRKFTFLVNEES